MGLRHRVPSPDARSGGQEAPRKIPRVHRDREPCATREFATRYFPQSRRQQEIAIRLRCGLEQHFDVDLSGLHPDDRILDIVELESADRDSLDRVEAHLYFSELWHDDLQASTWDPQTLPLHSFRHLVQEIDKAS